MKIKTKLQGGTLRLPADPDDPTRIPPPRGCG